MRILFINKASLKHEGGAEIRTKEVGRQLALLGHDVTVLAAKTNVNEPSFEVYDGMKLHHKQILPNWLIRRFPAPHYLSLAAGNLFLMFHIYLFLKRERFDLIREDISPFPPSGLLSLVKLPAVKRIAVVHNLPRTFKGWYRFYGPIYGFAGFVMGSLLRSGKLKYDQIICAGKWFADELKQHPEIAGKVSYIPNGVNLEYFSKNKTKHDSTNLIQLLSVGRLVETKGHRYLLEAISYLKSIYPQIRLDILGEGPLKDSLLELAKQIGVYDTLQFRSPVRHEEMPGIYDEYDLFVMPSVFEGFPLSIIEAMASRIPIIATDISGITGILDTSTATLAQSENAQDLYEKLKWAIEHPENIAQKTELAYEIAIKYDWHIIAGKEIGESSDKD